MRRYLTELRTSLIAIVVLTLLLGLAYPLAVTAISRVAYPGKSAGSLVRVDGKVVGSRLIARPFLQGRRADPRYFQPRPSATAYAPGATAFANNGPNQREARDFYRGALKAYLALERPYDPGLGAATVPVDAVTNSASGVDPHISVANARIQAHRVAAVRHLRLARVLALVAANTDGRFLGLLGEPGVNVLELDLALDREARS